MIAATIDPSSKKMATEQRFRELANQWKTECALISSTNDMATNFAYQQIIGMGPDVLPILLEEMQRDPDHWSWALRAITGENPVKDEHRGNLTLIAQDWIQWGKENGLLK